MTWRRRAVSLLSVLGGGELGDDGAAVDPDLLTADQPVAEAEDVEDAEGDSPSVAGDAEHLPDDRAGHVLLENHGVAIEEPIQRLLCFGAEVGGQELVEVPGRVLAGAGRAGKPHRVVDDVVGVHGYRAVDVAGPLCL